MQRKFMAEAIRLSVEKMQARQGGPFGALVVREGVLVARGWNRVTSGNDPTAHAEIVAIRKACLELKTFRLDDCEMYVSCEPCPMCLAAIYWAGIPRVYYAATGRDAAGSGFADEYIYRELARPVGQRDLVMEQTMRQEALAAFRIWEELEDKVEY